MTAEKETSKGIIEEMVKIISNMGIWNLSQEEVEDKFNAKLLAYFEKEKAELEKGCRCRFVYFNGKDDIEDYNENYKTGYANCGDWFDIPKTERMLCESCKAKLSQLQKDALNILGRTI